jgi:hypothetical protein
LGVGQHNLVADDDGVESERTRLGRVDGGVERRLYLPAVVFQIEAPCRAGATQGAEPVENIVWRRDHSPAARITTERGPIRIGERLLFPPLLGQRAQQVSIAAFAAGERAFRFAVPLGEGLEFLTPYAVGPPEDPRQQLFRLQPRRIERRIGIDELRSAIDRIAPRVGQRRQQSPPLLGLIEAASLEGVVAELVDRLLRRPRNKCLFDYPAK